MAASNSKILRALGHDAKLLETFCLLVLAEKPNRELTNWITEHAKDDSALPINEPNLTSFRQGYFSRWLARRDTLERIREQTAAAQQLVRESAGAGQALPQAVALQATSIVSEVLDSFDPEKLKETMAKNPKGFFALASSIQKLAQSDLGYREFKARVAFTKSKLKDQIADLKKAVRANPGSAEHSKKIAALIATIDSL